MVRCFGMADSFLLCRVGLAYGRIDGGHVDDAGVGSATQLLTVAIVTPATGSSCRLDGSLRQ